MAHCLNDYTKLFRKIKQTVSLSILIILGFTANGQSVSKEDAITVSENYMSHATGKTQRIVKEDEIYAKNTKCLYHFIFDDGSWCITSADMQTEPILAFGLTDGFSSMPDALSEIIDNYKTVIDSILNSPVDSVYSHPLWNKLFHSPKSANNYALGDSLLDMTGRGNLAWNQEFNNSGTCSPSYNKYCPDAGELSCPTPTFEDCNCSHKPAGCGAVAMGQIMWYWQWPKESRYNIYHWEKMPHAMYSYTPTDQADNIAHFLRDCGKASDMTYCCYGSWAYSDDIISAFQDDFGFESAEKQYANDWVYGDAWTELIKSEIDNGRPTLFYGDKGTFLSGHFFNVDGYIDNETVLFHVNWGFGGKYNCFCKLDRFKRRYFHDGEWETAYYNCHNRAIIGLSPTYNESHISNINYSNLPNVHKRKEYAYESISIPSTNNTLTINNGAEYILEAGNEIILQDGFEAKPGSEVEVRINPTWQSQMAISVTEWPTFTGSDGYCIYQKNADSWEFSLLNRQYDIVFQSAGSIRSDYVCLWDGHGLPSGSYLGIITLKNSYGRKLHQELDITVTNRELATKPDESEMTNENMLFTNPSNTIFEDSTLLVFPNPSKGIFELTLMSDSIMTINLYNSMGQYVYTDNNISSNHYKLNIYGFPSGYYIISIRGKQKEYTKTINKQ